MIICDKRLFSHHCSKSRGSFLRIQRTHLPKWGEFPGRLQVPVHVHRRGGGVRAPLPQQHAHSLPVLPRSAPDQSSRPVLLQHQLPQGSHHRVAGPPETLPSTVASVSVYSLPGIPLLQALPEAVPSQTQKGEGHLGERAAGGGATVGEATWNQAAEG